MSALGSLAIIGGGIIGRSCAYRLQQSGFDVTLFDNNSLLNAPSWNNAGHIATEQISPLASYEAIRSAPKRLFRVGGALDFSLMEAGVAKWVWQYLHASSPSKFAMGKLALATLVNQADEAWRQQLAALQVPELYKEKGHWVVWETEKTAVINAKRWAATDVGATRFDLLADNEINKLSERVKTSIAGGIAFTGTAQIADLPLLADKLKSAFLHAGGKWRLSDIAPLSQGNNALTVIDSEGSHTQFDKVLVCAGASSARVLQQVLPRVPLIAERGYHIEVPCTDASWPADIPPVVFEDRSMIVTRFANTLRACSFVEFSSLDAAPDERKWQRLNQHAQVLGLPFTADAKKWMGARPTLPDYLPAMGRSSNIENLYYAFGHQHLGLTLAAVSGQLMSELIIGGATPPALTPFSLNRFGL